MRDIAYIIPGYKDSRHNRKGYNAVAAFFRKRGVKPVRVSIDWNKKTRIFENFATQFLKQYKKPKDAKVYILGFSFGAVTALLAAPKVKPDALILCSLSPYFKEDMRAMRKKWLTWWRGHMKESDYPFNAIAPKIKMKTIIVVGDKEGREVVRRAQLAKRAIRKSSLVIVKGGIHKISQKVYLTALESVIAGL